MINIWVDLKQIVPDLPKDYARPVKEYAIDPATAKECPPLNIVIFIVGSRGDVQPYLALALRLIESNGHRVRIATHPDFKDFVQGTNSRLKGKSDRHGQSLEGRLEFYDIGGDPKELMAYMVKNPGLMPGWASLTNGDISSKRRMTGEMLDGFFESTYKPDAASGRPFAADAIISNPPAFAHIHVAEALGLPLLMTFTMPWSPTVSFKHPLVNIQSSNAEKGLTNYLTYAFAELMTWQGLGDVINGFRAATLGIEPLSIRSGANVVERLKVPWVYCWSEGLIPKPMDWKEHIDISGFYFMEGESDFKADKELVDFLAAGPPPIYIGFGSVVVEDATAMTQTIFDAVSKAGVRALVSAGWGGLGGTEVPKDVFIQTGNIPHDWLFAEGRVSAVCHHGGAGTTAIGLRNGLPTIVVPFFGDQKFWGDMIHRAGAGPAPIPHKELSSDNLAEAIRYATSSGAKEAAGRMKDTILNEDGLQKGVDLFHRHLPLKNMRCEISSERAAVWYSSDLCLRLSSAVAGTLHEAHKLDLNKLEPLRPTEYQSRSKSSDPLTGGTTAILHLLAKHYGGIAQIFYDTPKGIVNTATAIPQGMADLIIGVHEGFESIPRQLGSTVREREKVDDLASGIREGGKGLFFGWWDGITGLVTEPIEGGKKEGALGVLKGMGRSYINVTARPAAGITGMMALPLHGAWQSLRKKMAGTPQFSLREPRITLSTEAASHLTPEEKKEILAKFAEAEKGTGERKARLKVRTKMFLSGDDAALEDDAEIKPAELEEAKKDTARELEAATEAKPKSEVVEDKRDQAVKDAEQRGYERALAELKAKQT
ncbi:glycosyltransferase family 1 protein [Naematelia encephala]|uniref:Glycosyltransferase family 1 protein n=1 Tax=Naematelia encephala TaxID=71784 RepID=A0A1Y2BA60_9TREE|nr:glycosyltransferase family 1 protein [Naematelia encephala]